MGIAVLNIVLIVVCIGLAIASFLLNKKQKGDIKKK